VRTSHVVIHRCAQLCGQGTAPVTDTARRRSTRDGYVSERALASPASPRQSALADALERRVTHRFHGKQRGDECGTGTRAVDVLVSAVITLTYRSLFA